MNINKLPKETKIDLFEEALSYCFFAHAFRYLENSRKEEINIAIKDIVEDILNTNGYKLTTVFYRITNLKYIEFRMMNDKYVLEIRVDVDNGNNLIKKYL